jgi:hypothetical protein
MAPVKIAMPPSRMGDARLSLWVMSGYARSLQGPSLGACALSHEASRLGLFSARAASIPHLASATDQHTAMSAASLAALPAPLRPTDDDWAKMLAAHVHLGTKNLDNKMVRCRAFAISRRRPRHGERGGGSLLAT